MSNKLKQEINYKNIYYMITYCVDELKYFDDANIKYEELKGTHDLLATLLNNAFDIVYRDGYIKTYSKSEIITDKPRGRLNIPKSIISGAAGKGRINCEVYSLDTNNKLNQIMKAAFTVLINSNSIIDDKISEELLIGLYHRRELLGQITDIEITYELWLNLSNIPEQYKSVIAVAKLILNEWIAKDEDGNFRVLELSDKKRLCYIWEKYLRTFITNNYPKYRVSKQCMKETTGDNREPDIIIKDTHNKRLLILDAKWYNRQESTKSGRDKLLGDCTVSQNKENPGYGLDVTGLCVYAADKKSCIEKTGIINTNGVVYSSAFISVNTDMKITEDQIRWVVEQGFNLTPKNEVTYYPNNV